MTPSFGPPSTPYNTPPSAPSVGFGLLGPPIPAPQPGFLGPPVSLGSMFGFGPPGVLPAPVNPPLPVGQGGGHENPNGRPNQGPQPQGGQTFGPPGQQGAPNPPVWLGPPAHQPPPINPPFPPGQHFLGPPVHDGNAIGQMIALALLHFMSQPQKNAGHHPHGGTPSTIYTGGRNPVIDAGPVYTGN